MSFGTPWMLLWLPSLGLVGWLALRSRRLQQEGACRVKGGSPGIASRRFGPGDGLRLAALGCVILALARPQWSPQPCETDIQARDLVIALDLSRSMLAADVAPSRLEAARIAIHEALPAWAGQRIALVTFAGSASVRVPLTLDHGFVRYMLERVDPSDVDLGSTSLEAAFEKVLGAVMTGPVRGRCDLVMFTDGEDHLSDLDKTAERLARSGARVLIVGLGDPVQGARVPDASGAPGPWMQYREAEVISRLDEGSLAKLAGKNSKATFYPARTRPFDLVALYEGLISGASADGAAGELRQVRYAEGYPYLLGLSVALWLASSPWGLPAFCRLLPLLVVLLSAGCGRRSDEATEAAFRGRLRRGVELAGHAQEQSGLDPVSARSLLVDARESFLCAALLRPGDLETARQITAVTRRLREFDAALEKQRAAEDKRHAKLGELIRQLEALALRQTRLSQQSARLLARRLVPASADLSNSSESDNDMSEEYPIASNSNDRRLAATAAGEQQAVEEGTALILDTVTLQRETLRRWLAEAYGTDKLPATEFDPAVDLLAGARAAQQRARASLAPQPPSWPGANTAFHVAAGHLEQALDSLKSLQPPVKDRDEEAMPPANSDESQEALNSPNSGSPGKQSPPVSPDDATMALEMRSLPVPNYTPDEILEEEAANQQKRARLKAARAGAKVEKNW